MMYADIVLPLAQPTYSFAVPEGVELQCGDAVAVQFGQQKPLAGWLLVPYLLWVTFAGVLNFAVARMNP